MNFGVDTILNTPSNSIIQNKVIRRPISTNITNNATFRNVGYRDIRNLKQIINIDIALPNGTNTFNGTDSNSGKFHIPIKIDSLCDIFLDNFTTFDASPNTSSANNAFVLDIDQFPIKLCSNKEHLYNKIIIPNEDGLGTNKFKIHKGRKQNYICTINPQTLTKLSGSLRNMSDGATIGGNNFRFIAEFVLISRN